MHESVHFKEMRIIIGVPLMRDFVKALLKTSFLLLSCIKEYPKAQSSLCLRSNNGDAFKLAKTHLMTAYLLCMPVLVCMFCLLVIPNTDGESAHPFFNS